MAFTIDESFLPVTLTARPMTDAEFSAFCGEHPDLFFEMTAEGEIIVMAPTFSLTGVRNANIIRQLDAWAEQDGRGSVNDSSAGFVLPNGARRSPYASWTLNARINRLPEESLQGFWHLCPDFVIELKSKSERAKSLRKKMQEYVTSGAQLGWLIDPETQTVEVYRPDQQPETLIGLTTVAGEAPIQGFNLDLAKVWNPRIF